MGMIKLKGVTMGNTIFKLELNRESSEDNITKCPMCGDTNSMVETFTDLSGHVAREVHVCQPCPCIWFDYYSSEDIHRLLGVV